MFRSRTHMLRLANRYVAHRRAFGFALKVESRLVREFARFADLCAPGKPITAAMSLEWATRASGSALYHAKRLEALRGFARYCAALDARVEIPPAQLLGTAHRRIAPHIYSDEQIALLMRRATPASRGNRGGNIRPNYPIDMRKRRKKGGVFLLCFL